jgi:hypothetical protein
VGWIGWAGLHFFSNRRPKDHGRAEELLLRGYSTHGVRDREAIAERLASLYEETGRVKEAQGMAGSASRAGPPASGMSVRRTVDLVEDGDRATRNSRMTAAGLLPPSSSGTRHGREKPLPRMSGGLLVCRW